MTKVCSDIYVNWYIIIAIDRTGIKVTNRGQWMREQMEYEKIRKDI